MLDPRKAAELEQALAYMRDALPALWATLVDGLEERGFTREEALDALKVYILSGASGGVTFNFPPIKDDGNGSKGM